ncbi:MAG: M24 family metallopeptidase, partial [Clostridia bacterium]|nr:M24 family metallopeptidase [Clostridia bacterium]
FGAKIGGYCSDMTRTVAFGHVTEEMEHVYNTVLKAQLACLEGAKLGMPGKEIDALARDIITEAGYGECFQHGLGHCIGLAVHEGPRANKIDPTPLAAGNILTIEPGIYIEGKFGVRIEDMLYFGENGTENLTHMPKELIIIK